MKAPFLLVLVFFFFSLISHGQVSIIGTASPAGHWQEDFDMSQDPGDPDKWFISLTLNVGELKFRKDGDWSVEWGGNTFPAGTGFQGGPNIPINVASSYFITFRESTGEYNFIDNSAGCVIPNTLYVNNSVIGGDSSGVSWTNAMPSLATAIDIANNNPSIENIYVAKGIYRPELPTCPNNLYCSTFFIDRGYNIFGGFEGTECDPSQRNFIERRLPKGELTILSGDLGYNDVTSLGITTRDNDIVYDTNLVVDNVYHVVTMRGVGTEMVLDGFAITGGYANNSTGDYFHKSGGGLMNDGSMNESSPQISNCVFQGNLAAQWGGGVLNVGLTKPIFNQCEFIFNTSYLDGGGVCNMADESFVGINVESDASPIITNCRFAGNFASNYGAGMYSIGEEGGVSNPKIIQSIFSGNKAGNQGASLVYNGSTSVGLILNSTFSGNIPNALYVDSANVKVYNSIIYNNGLLLGSQLGGNLNLYDVQNSLISGVKPSGINIYDFDPLFLSPIDLNGSIPTINGSFKVEDCSPVLDAGSKSLFTNNYNGIFDYEGKVRDGENIDLGPFEKPSTGSFIATESENDAYIDLAWEILAEDCQCLIEDPVLKKGVTVQLKSGGSIIDTWVVYPENYTNSYSFSYRDFVGPDVYKEYDLEFKRSGPGTLNCLFSTSGSTTSFASPELISISNAEAPDSIKISWRNKSKLTNGYKVYRDGVLIKTMDATDNIDVNYTFNDVYRVDQSGIQNGSSYNYCIETISDIYRAIYNTEVPELLCQNGSTYDIGLTASDDAFNDRVELTWNNVGQYSDFIRITRNGNVLTSLPSTATSYIDQIPIPGKENIYGVELMRYNAPFVGSYDAGSIPANGSIIGYVSTSNQKIPVRDAVITLSWNDGGESVSISDTTLYDGSFSFNQLYYDDERKFTLTASLDGVSFTENPIEVILSLSEPNVYDVRFYANVASLADTLHYADVNFFNVTQMAEDDATLGSWQFAKSDPTDTVYFNYYRGSTLINQTVDVQNTLNNISYSHLDKDGIPGATYTYYLYAYTIEEGQIRDTTIFRTITFPEVSMPQNLLVIPNNTRRVVDVSWTNNSMNIDGYKLYRMQSGTKTIYNGPEQTFVDLTGAADQGADYFVTSFRNVNGIDYESQPTPVVNVLYPPFTPIHDLVITPIDHEDKMNLFFTPPAVYSSDYNYNGFRIYRSESGVSESSKLIRSLNKQIITAGEAFIFDDFSGKPSVNYTYEIRPYNEVDDTIYESLGNTPSNLFPSVSSPLDLAAISDTSKITLLWDSPYRSNNVEGFVIAKKEIPNQDTIAHVSLRPLNTFTDFVNKASSQEERYEVSTFRIVEGDTFYSLPAVVIADPPLSNGSDPIFISNFTATRDISSHIKLCWEWLDIATETPFIIRRNGEVIANESFTSRAYFDYEAPIGVEVEYSLETPGVNGSLDYQWVYASGIRPSKKSLLGRVYESASQKGIDNIDINLSLDKTSDKYRFPTLTTQDLSVKETKIFINENISIADLNLKISSTHTFFQELIIKLISPAGSIIEIMNLSSEAYQCFGNGLDIVFDDSAIQLHSDINDQCNGDVKVIGSFKPLEFLGTLNGETLNGEWILSVEDLYNEDGGQINAEMFVKYEDGVEVYSDQTASDGTGFFRIDDLPINLGSGYEMNVLADSTNNRFIQNPVSLLIGSQDSLELYEVNFLDTLSKEESENLAEILNISTIPNSLSMSVGISWSPSNENYTGFEVYRGTELIAEVLKGSPLFIQDFDGFPGVLTTYSVRAFTMEEGDKVYSSFLSATTLFPDLRPIENLTANPIIADNLVEVRWSHPNDNHDYYLVTRNGAPFDVVQTKNEMMSIDTTGIPGKLYRYEVFVIQGNYSSLGVSTSVIYPLPEPIRNFNLSIPPGKYGFGENYVKVDWLYTYGAADAFNVIRYIVNGNKKDDEEVVARVDGSNRTYKDYEGLPNQLYHYEVVPVLIRDGIEYVAPRRTAWSENIVFPLIAPADGVFIYSTYGTVSIEATYEYSGADGIEFYSNDILYAKIPFQKIDFPQTVIAEDSHGTPSTLTEYSIRAFSERGGTTYYSVFTPGEVTYPSPPVPLSFEATDHLYPNKIVLTWDYDIRSVIDEFRIERNVANSGWEIIATATPGERTYDDFLNFEIQQTSDIPIEYRISAINKGVASSFAVDEGSLYSGGLEESFTGEDTHGYKRDDLGMSVDMSEDYAISNFRNGFAIFRKDSTVWKEDSIFTPSSFDLDSLTLFAQNVAISGDFAVVSSQRENSNEGVVIVLRRSVDGWVQDAVINAPSNTFDFGLSVDIYDDPIPFGKDLLIVSANNTNNFGRVFLYERVNGNWVLKYNRSGSNSGGRFGTYVSVSKNYSVIYQPHSVGRGLHSIIHDDFSNGGSLLGFQYSSLDIRENHVVATRGGGIAELFTINNTGFILDETFTDNSVASNARILGNEIIISNTADQTTTVYQKVGIEGWKINQTILPTGSITSSFGRSIAMSLDFYMISGESDSGDGVVYFYPKNVVRLGECVDIDGDWAVAGTNGSGFVIYKKRDDNTWTVHQKFGNNFNEVVPSDGFGKVVSISGKYIAVGAPYDEKNKGAVYIFERQSDGKWDLSEKIILTNIYYKLFGTDIEIVDNDGLGASDYLYVVSQFRNVDKSVVAFKRTNNGWNNFEVELNHSHSQDLSVHANKNQVILADFKAVRLFNPGEYMSIGQYSPGDYTGWAMSSDIIVGAEQNELRVLDINLGALTLLDSESNPVGEPSFGKNLSINEDNLIVVGSPDNDRIHLYEFDSEIGSIRVIDNESSDGQSFYGYDLAISGNTIIVGAPGYNDSKGKVHFVEALNLPPPPSNVNATDGTQTGQVTITWDAPSQSGTIDGYKVFRDGIHLANIGPVDGLSYIDLPPTGLVPGKVYIYQVQSTKGQLTSLSIGDSGFMPPNGTISGKLTTLQGSAPIEGATISASVLVDGDYKTYETTTDAVGNYVINEIYYAERSTLIVTCNYLDHEIISQESVNADPQLEEIEIVLEINNNQSSEVNFFDITAYSITGNVSHKSIEDCNLENIEIKRRYIINQNGNEIVQDELKTTDEDGNYAFIIDPEVTGLEKIELMINDTLVINDKINLHDFKAITDESIVPIREEDGIPEINEFGLDRNTVVDFQDQTLYPVSIHVINTCGDILSPGDVWTIKVKSLDGCYEKTFQTNISNATLPSLPPRSMAINVIDVDNKTTENLIFLDYLINNPVVLDLDSIHINEADDLSQEELLARTKVLLEFHKPPVITADFSSFQFMCDDDNSEMIIQSGEEYSFSIDVVEPFSTDCAVTSGYIKIVNDADKVPQPVIIPYDIDIAGFPDYNFIAGAPNPVIPHSWNISIEYYSNAGNLQGSISKAFIVEGSYQLPGNGILTDASQGFNEVPLPLFVLRDPPGDRSYSSIESGHEVVKSFSFKDADDESVSFKDGVRAEIAGIAASFGAGITSGTYDETTEELEFTTRITETISTDGGNGTQEELIGRQASIIVGAGVVMQTGIKNTLRVTDCGEVTETRSVGFTPVELKTTWTYTVQFIEDLILNYEQDILEIQSGQLVLFDELGDPIPKQEAIDRFIIQKSNWEQIIHYFEMETNPLYYYTSADFTNYKKFKKVEVFSGGSILNPTTSTLNEEANKWSLKLRNEFMVNGQLDLEQVITQEKLDKYNNAATAIRELMSFEDELNQNSKQNLFELWEYSDARYNNTNYYTTVPGISVNEMAENRTFSGLTNQTFTYEQSKSVKKGSVITTYTNGNVYAGIDVNVGLETFVGLGAGVINKVFEVSGFAELSTDISYSTSEETVVGSTDFAQVSYFLSDSDPTDEFSVTILKGVDLNHTPFFQLVGGQSSCPYEPGTLNKDNPKILVLNPDSGAAGSYASLKFQDPEQPAEFTITVTNLSNTQDSRDIEVFLDNNSNSNGAKVTLGGAILGSQVYTSLGYNNPLQLTLTVERGQAFDYSGLRIGVRPACEGKNVEEFITLDVQFQSPCSPISIIQPDNNWLINSSSPELIIGLQDYVPSTPNFEGLTLEYRRLGSSSTGFNSGWETIPYTNIKESFVQNNPVSADTLQAYNDLNFLPGETPTYFMVWEPEEGNSSLFPDGDYELRVRSTCDENGLKNYSFSNVVPGKIDRQRLQLFGTPQPSDGIWIPGDEIAVAFNKNLDCISISDPDFQDRYLKAEVDGVRVSEAVFTCFNNEIMVTIPDMSIYDGKVMTLSVDSITDPNGNLAYDLDGFSRKIEWDFLVTTQKAYWEQDSLVVQLYEGESVVVNAGIRNTELQTSLSGLQLSRSTGSSSWLSIDPDPVNTFEINPGAVKQVFLTFSASQEGILYDTLKINNIPGSSTSPALPIKLITLKRPPFPPDWEVDGNIYPDAMTVVANYQYTDEQILSTDTMDLVTAWIGNTIRGVARISEIGNNRFAAYLNVFGNSGDAGKTLEFRIWDASEDDEYNAHADPQVSFSQGSFIGLSIDPVVLEIDRSKDRARYIPLNQGFTWISLNSEEEDMSVGNILRELSNVTEGDRIIGQNGFSEYINGVGWIADPMVMLETLSTEESYMVYLQNGPDTIRMTGSDAQQFSKLLLEGTNWIGFPSQSAQLVENAIGVTSLANVTQLRNKDQSRLSIGNEWSDGNLTTMHPNDGFQLTVSQALILTMPGVSGTEKVNGDNISTRNFTYEANPWDASTWNLTLDEYAYKENIPLVGTIRNGSKFIESGGDHKIAVFIGNDLRGVSTVNNISELSKDFFSIIVGVNDLSLDTLYTLYYYDGVKVVDSVNIETTDMLASGNGRYSYMNPFDFDFCKSDVNLLLGKHRLEGTYSAKNLITIEEGIHVEPNKIVKLSAPEVKFQGEADIGDNSILIISKDGCQNE